MATAYTVGGIDFQQFKFLLGGLGEDSWEQKEKSKVKRAFIPFICSHKLKGRKRGKEEKMKEEGEGEERMGKRCHNLESGPFEFHVMCNKHQ